MLFFSQITILFFAAFCGPEEAAFTWPFRRVLNGSPIAKPYLKRAHNFGAWGVGVVCVGMALQITIAKGCNISLHPFPWKALEFFTVLTLLYLFIYWLVFDAVYAKCINEKWYYLGTTAQMDKTLRRFGIRNVGIYKAAFCVLAITVLNIAAKFLC